MAKLAMGRVLEIKPNDPEALSYLGVIEMHNFDFSAAKNYFSKALSIEFEIRTFNIGFDIFV